MERYFKIFSVSEYSINYISLHGVSATVQFYFGTTNQFTNEQYHSCHVLGQCATFNLILNRFPKCLLVPSLIIFCILFSTLIWYTCQPANNIPYVTSKISSLVSKILWKQFQFRHEIGAKFWVWGHCSRVEQITTSSVKSSSAKQTLKI